MKFFSTYLLLHMPPVVVNFMYQVVWAIVVWSNTNLDMSAKAFFDAINIYNLLILRKWPSTCNKLKALRAKSEENCNRNPAWFSSLRAGLIHLNSRLQHRLLHEFPACQVALQMSDLPAPIIEWAKSLKLISFSSSPEPWLIQILVLWHGDAAVRST